MRIRSTVTTVVVSALIGLAIAESGCVDTSAPKGVEAISIIGFPSPSVVVGDVMRDSLGAPAPLQVTAYDGAGNPIPNADIVYVVLDPSISVDVDGTLHGLAIDSIGGRVVAGVGTLQGPIAHILVTVKPDNASGGGIVAVLNFPKPAAQGPADSIVTSAIMTVTVTNALTARGAQGIIVKYDVIGAPTPVTAALPTTFITNDLGGFSTRDTTDIHGVASRRVSLLHRRIGEAGLINGTATDTITVRATVQYAGLDLAGSPLIFKVPVALQQ